MSKVGRNDPCPCGSGRKYKHCCLPGQLKHPEQAAPEAGQRPRMQTRWLALILLGVALLLGALAWWLRDPRAGVTIFAAAAVFGAGYLAIRGAPPSQGGENDGTGIGFGL